MDLIGMIVGAVVLSLTHVCAYQFGKYQGWLDMFRVCIQDKKCVLLLKEGETLDKACSSKGDDRMTYERTG